MKTATVDDLENRLAVVLGWLQSGEDVVVKAPAKAAANQQTEGAVDWTKSAVFRRPMTPVDLSKSTVYRDRTGEPVLSQADLDALFDHLRGPY